MFSKLALISLEEMKFMSSRVVVYTAVAYLTVRAVGFATDQASRLLGLDTPRS